MCGRAYETYTEDEIALRYLNKKTIQIPKFKPNYNFCPSQDSPIVRSHQGERQIELFRWGLIPSWAKEAKIGFNMINARAETIDEKPSFKNAFKKRRCIVPFSGFVEWKRDGSVKRPFAISLQNDPIMSLAGIWEKWISPDGGEIFSFSIITTDSNEFMSRIHDRMPVILSKEQEDFWLDEKNEDVSKLKEMLKPCPSEWLSAYEISTLINSPKNNDPKLLEKI